MCPGQMDSLDQLAELPHKAELSEANINPATLLATDYMNHFHEVVMLIDMLPMMPDCSDDILAWRPLPYKAYFEQSAFKGKKLAIAAYDHVKSDLKIRFESMIDETDVKINLLVERIREVVDPTAPDAYEMIIFTTDSELRPLIDATSGLINGNEGTTDWMLAAQHPTAQDAVDMLFD